MSHDFLVRAYPVTRLQLTGPAMVRPCCVGHQYKSWGSISADYLAVSPFIEHYSKDEAEVASMCTRVAFPYHLMAFTVEE